MPKRARARLAVVAAPAAVAAVLLAASPAVAAEHGEDDGSNAERMAREGVEQLMKALDTFLSSIPRYGTPYVDDEGNIVIPRLDDPDEDGGDGGEPDAGSDEDPGQTEI